MASNTTNLNLYKKDPIEDKDQTFNIKTMMNDNWDKIDQFSYDIKELKADRTMIENSYFFDLEAYYGNTKLIDDFQDMSRWTATGGTLATDISNYKLGKQSLRLTQTISVASIVGMSLNNLNLNLTALNNSELSSESDYIATAFYISDITKIDFTGGQGIWILFDQTTPSAGVDTKYCKIGVSGLTTGWNYLKIKKSEFLTNVNGNWTGIKSVHLRWFSTANAQNAYVSFQLLQLVKKDPLEDKPNPFQKFGQRELNHHFGEWFIGYEFDNLVAKELSGSIASIRSLSSINKYKDCYAEFITTKTGNDCIIGGLYGTSGDYISLKVEGSLFLVGIRVANVDTLHTFTVSGTDFTVNLNRKDNNIEVIVNGGPLLTTTFDYLEEVNLAIGSNNPEVSYIKSATITEIAHSHHADIAERLSEKGKLDLLRVPKYISNSNNTIMQLGHVVDGFSIYAKIMRPSLNDGSQLSYAELFLGKYKTGATVQGKLQYLMDLTLGTYKLRFKLTDKGILYALSPQYNYSTLTMIEARGFTEDIKTVPAIEGNVIWDSEGNTRSVCVNEAPTETVITSGFAAGWSGEIRLGKTQEGIKYIHIVSLAKTSDISTGGDIPYTIPIGHRPIKTVSENLVGYSSSGPFKAGSSIQVRVQSDGVLALTSTGSVTADVRSIVGALLTFI